MNIPFIKSARLTQRRIDLATFFRKVLWLGIVILSILYSVTGSRASLSYFETELEIWVYVYLNFLSFLLSVIVGAVIFFRKPKSWMAFMTSVMLVTFTATDSGFQFWYQLLTGQSPDLSFESVPYIIASFSNVLYIVLVTISLAFVSMAFPDGRMSRTARWCFFLLIAMEVLIIFFFAVMGLLGMVTDLYSVETSYALLDIVKAILLLLLCPWPIYRLRKTTDPVQRQQIKWVALSLTGMTFFVVVSQFFWFFAWDPLQLVLAFLVGLISTYLFIISLLIAIIHYRLWDMGFIVNQALVYSAVSTILAVFGVVGARLLEDFARENMAGPGSKFVGAFIVLPIIALFSPLRDRMQMLVDRHFKPEEIDFSSALVELAPESQLVLTSRQILRILVQQSIEQLNLDHAVIYLKDSDGQLVQEEPSSADSPMTKLDLDEKTRTELEKGNVVPSPIAQFSLYVPLVVKRAVKPQFLGVLVFGAHNNGEGYSTLVLKSLKKLGYDAGRAIHIAQLREHLGQNVSERLSAIESSLATLSKAERA